MEPTEEQIKEFWEWCGFKWEKIDYVSSLSSELNGTYEAWESPLASQGDKSQPLKPEEVMDELPMVDLNNLFKYAVPKLDYWLLSAEKTKRAGAVAQFRGKSSGTIFSKDPALALFWAIWEVIHND